MHWLWFMTVLLCGSCSLEHLYLWSIWETQKKILLTEPAAHPLLCQHFPLCPCGCFFVFLMWLPLLNCTAHFYSCLNTPPLGCAHKRRTANPFSSSLASSHHSLRLTLTSVLLIDFNPLLLLPSSLTSFYFKDSVCLCSNYAQTHNSWKVHHYDPFEFVFHGGWRDLRPLWSQCDNLLSPEGVDGYR